MTMGEKLRRARKENKISQAQAAEHLSRQGLEATQAAVSRWERGDVIPNAEQFLCLCQLYGIRDVMARFRPGHSLRGGQLNELGQRRLAEYARLLSLDPEFAAPVTDGDIPHLRTIPLYSLPASAGTGQFLDSSEYELIEVGDTAPVSASFAVRISGDSMLPLFADQQIVYVRQQQTLRSGDIGIFVLNGDAYCKQLGSSGGSAALISLNGEKYQPIVISESDELRVLGKVVS
ncbi:MAG: LexA family transcriptional regulator [Oscillospiraceae bacterium]|nr:LexA family transcriptional regulator [Oscillospiraceae bacterium]